MQRHNVNGISIVYETTGAGPNVAWSSGGGGTRDVVRPVAKALSTDFKVLFYDCRNRGASDIALSDSLTDFATWADDLHSLLSAINISPAFAGGGSGGAMISLRLVKQYPEDVRALVLVGPPTDDVTFREVFADLVYFQSADVAEKQGMLKIVESNIGWGSWADRIEQNPGNRARLLSMDPNQFASCMRRWGNWALSGRVQYAGLTDDELSKIDVPVLIIPGMDEQYELPYKEKIVSVTPHPRRAAEKLHELIPHSKMVPLDEAIPASILATLHEGPDYDVALVPIIKDFLQRIK